MRCPRCRELQDILNYSVLEQKAAFAHETNPVYKCPKCRWAFSPALSLEDKLNEAVHLLRQYRPDLLALREVVNA